MIMILYKFSDYEMRLVRAYITGIKAYEVGKDLDDNPYTGRFANWWTMGWKWARKRAGGQPGMVKNE